MNYSKRVRNIVFLLLPKTHLIDLAGPAQVFYEANRIGELNLKIRYASADSRIRTEQGLMLSGLVHYESIALDREDFVIIPGIDFAAFERGELHDDIRKITPWLRQKNESGVQIASICSGSLILAEAGLLDGRTSTSHWKCIDYMEKQYPDTRVQSDQLFVKSGNLYTSAGMTSGMDMSLAILEELYGPIISSKVARELVIYLRRDQTSSQETVYLDYQTHFSPAIHKVQNYLVSHPDRNPGLQELADIANMSVRNLTRTFKEKTGHTISEFKHEVKLEVAKMLLNNPDYTIAAIAEECGFKDPRQLRRIWKDKFGKTLSGYRNEQSHTEC